MSDSSLVRRALDVIRKTASELIGSGVGVDLDSDLERHLGLGSLERVELISRLEAAFGVSLPDSALAEARTVRQLVELLERSGPGPGIGLEHDAFEPSAEAAPFRLPTGREARTVFDLLRFRAEWNGELTHIHVLDDGLKPKPLSFSELWSSALGVGARLASLGIRRGDRVALILPTGRDFFVGFMGILAAGAVPVPLYPPIRLDQLGAYLQRHGPILANAGVRALLTDAALKPVAGLLRDQTPGAEHVLTLDAPFELGGFGGVETREEDLGLIQYTSGSTGDPKGVALRHVNLLANVRAIGQGLGIGPGDVCVSWLPLYHDMGLIGAWLTSLFYSMPLVILSPLQFLSRPERWLWAIHRFRGSISPAPNFGYELCCRKIPDSALEGLDLSSWRAAMNGSEPVLPETLERFSARFAPHGFRPGSMMPVYGMAENCVGLAFPPPGREPRIDGIDRERFTAEHRAEPSEEPGRPRLRLPSVGRALEGNEILVVAASEDEPLRPEALPERREGRILFRGPSAMAGYFGRPEATTAIRVGDWLDSGDLGYVADGELYVTGRAKDLVIKGGRKYHPQDIERAAASVEGIRKGCVVAFAAPDPQRGEAIVVVAETAQAGLPGLEARVAEAVLDAIGTPADHIVLVPQGSIPKTSSGKLRRRETRQRFLDGTLGRPRPRWSTLARVGLRSLGRRSLDGLRAARRLAYGLAATAVGCFLLGLCTLAVRTRSRPELAWRTAGGWLRFLFRAIGIPIRREGAPLAPGPAVLVANHGSYLDALFIVAMLERPVAVLAAEHAFHWRWIGPCLKRLGCVPVQRASGRTALDAYAQAREALRRGQAVLIFPEGTFTAADGVRPFRMGAFQLAAEEGVPIQAIGLRGIRHIYRDGHRLLSWGCVDIEFLEPVAPVARERLGEISAQRDSVRQAISVACGEPLLQISSVALPPT